MICQLCMKKNIQKIKTVRDVDIFECRDCQLAFVDQRRINILNPQEEYDLQSYRENQNRFCERFEKLIEKIHKYKKSGRVLDVGAGYGLLSSMLYEKGYDIDIIEPVNIPYYLKGKKIKQYKTTIEDFLSRNKAQYDIIFMMDVIEHLSKPLKILPYLRRSLNKNGIIIIQTPNYKSVMARICKNWSWWMVSDHKFFFSPRSIKLLFQKAGFDISHVSTYEGLYEFKKNLDGNFSSIQNPFIRKITKGLFYLAFFPFYFIFKKIIWRFGYGGLIVVLGV